MTAPVIPDTQKAWVSVRRGLPSKSLELKKEWPVKKVLKPGEVLVKVHAGALNPIGYKCMKLLPNFMAKRPYVAEHDLSGVVVDANGSQELKYGDEVFGWLPTQDTFSTGQGALQQFAAVPAKNLVPRPSTLSEVEAAGVTLTSMTALEIINMSGLEEGQTLFVNGGSTSVGAFAIQLAKAKGAKVVATASKKNEQYVKGLGADEFIDYTSVGPLHTYLTKNPPSAKYNVILEAVGTFDPSLYTHCAGYLAPNGVYVSTGPQPHKCDFGTIGMAFKWLGVMAFPSFLSGVKQKLKFTSVDNKQENLKRLQTYFAEGKLKATVDSVYPFDDALKAYERIMTSRARGKVTVNVGLPESVETAK